MTEHCEFGEGMRVSSTDLFYRYQAKNEEATNKWFHAQMKVKGFVNKTVRVKGGTVTGYDGFQLKVPDVLTSSLSERAFCAGLQEATGWTFETGVRPDWLKNPVTGTG